MEEIKLINIQLFELLRFTDISEVVLYKSNELTIERKISSWYDLHSSTTISFENIKIYPKTTE